MVGRSRRLEDGDLGAAEAVGKEARIVLAEATRVAIHSILEASSGAINRAFWSLLSRSQRAGAESRSSEPTRTARVRPSGEIESEPSGAEASMTGNFR